MLSSSGSKFLEEVGYKSVVSMDFKRDYFSNPSDKSGLLVGMQLQAEGYRISADKQTNKIIIYFRATNCSDMIWKTKLKFTLDLQNKIVCKIK